MYDDKDFANHHTHVIASRLAKAIKKNVLADFVPDSTDIQFLISHIRVASNQEYINRLRMKISELEHSQKLNTVARKSRKRLLSKLEGLIVLDLSRIMETSPQHAKDFIISVKKTLKLMTYEIDVSYSITHNAFRLYYNNIVNPKSFELMLYQNGTARLTVYENNKISICKHFNDTDPDRLVSTINNYLKVGDF